MQNLNRTLLFFLSLTILLSATPAKSSKYVQPCDVIGGIAGPEDIEIDQQRGRAYISSSERRYTRSDDKIYSLNLNEASFFAVPMLRTNLPAQPTAFHPHGISYVEENGNRYLWVINHVSASQTNIERYRIQSETELALEVSVSDPQILNSNDLVGVSKDEFYVTVDHYEAPMWKKALLDLVKFKNGYVMYFNATRFYRVADAIAYPNGIAISKDRKSLYVSSTIGNSVRIYNFNSTLKKWELSKVIKTPGLADNLSFDSRGNLFVGIQPSAYKFARHALDSSYHAGSRVSKIALMSKKHPNKVSVVFDDLAGLEIEGSSVGAPYKNLLLVGGVFDHRVLVCHR